MPLTLSLSPYPLAIFFTVAALCIIFIGVDKAGLGSGLGVLATPLMTMFMFNSKDAIGVILPVLCVCDLFALWHYRSVYDRRNLKLMLPGSLLGIAVAGGVLWLLRGNHGALDRFLKILIGVSSVIFVAFQWMPKGLFTRGGRYVPGSPAATFAGWASGFTSTLAHAGGPPATMFLLPQQLDFRVFIGTTVWFFTITNYLKLIPYAMLGLMRRECILFSLTLMPLAPVGIALGVWLTSRINQKVFKNVVLTVLLLTGLQFITGMTISDLLGLLKR